MAQGRIAVRPEDDQRSRLWCEPGRLNTVFFLTAVMVAVDTIGAIAIGGAEAFTWLIVLFVFFFVRSALIGRGARRRDTGGGRDCVLGAPGVRSVRRCSGRGDRNLQ